MTETDLHEFLPPVVLMIPYLSTPYRPSVSGGIDFNLDIKLNTNVDINLDLTRHQF